MKNLLIAILAILIAMQGCKNQDNNSQLTTLDLTGKLSDETFDLSKHVTDVKMIRLETNANSFIQDFVGHVGEKFIINIDMNKVILFSSAGEYITTIINKGRGPQEFSLIDAWAVDGSENRFLFHDRLKNFIFNFNLNTLQFEKSIPFEEHGSLFKMIFINDTTLSILPARLAEYEYLFFNQTLSGEIIGGIKNETLPEDNFLGSPPTFNLAIDNSIIFQPPQVDTIFRVEGTQMTPIYALQFAKPITSGNKFNSEFTMYTYLDDKQIIFTELGYEGIIGPDGQKSISSILPGLKYFCFDLSTMQKNKIGPLMWNSIDLEIGDSNFPFPKNNQIVLTYQAFEFKEMIDETIKSKDLTESEKDSLEKLSNEISENDNPIIITGKLN